MSGDPNPEAETLRQQIKDIISEAAQGDGTSDVDRLQSKDGRITYIGNSLGFAVGGLRKNLGTESTEWGYTVWHFPGNKRVSNLKRNMQVVSLSDKSSITPGGPLTDFLTKVTHDKPEIGSGSTVTVFLQYA